MTRSPKEDFKAANSSSKFTWRFTKLISGGIDLLFGQIFSSERLTVAVRAQVQLGISLTGCVSMMWEPKTITQAEWSMKNSSSSSTYYVICGYPSSAVYVQAFQSLLMGLSSTNLMPRHGEPSISAATVAVYKFLCFLFWLQLPG